MNTQSKQDRAAAKRIRQAIFRANQDVNGRFVMWSRYNPQKLEESPAAYKERCYTWIGEQMTVALGPACAILMEELAKGAFVDDEGAQCDSWR